MTHDEFRQWLGHHLSRFTSASAWLSNFPSSPRFVTDVTQGMIRAAWFDVLRHTELADAKAATDSLFSGEDQFPSPGFDCHPATVRKIAVRHARFRVPIVAPASNWREDTYRCLLCWDVGLVIVWHPDVVREARADRQRWLAVGSVYDCAVACTCQAGERWSSKWRDDNERKRGRVAIRTYNEKTMPMYPENFRPGEGKQALLAWLDANPAADKYDFMEQFT